MEKACTVLLVGRIFSIRIYYSDHWINTIFILRPKLDDERVVLELISRFLYRGSELDK
jgi:hypothetical protein